jgi:hypothetical protein
VVDVSAALVGALTGRALAPGAEVDLSLLSPAHGLGAHVSVYGSDARTLSLGRGKVAFTRPGIGLGGRYRFARGRVFVELDATFDLALVIDEGQGFVGTRTAFDVDVGLGGGVRAGLRWRWARPFIGVAAVGWLRSLSAVATGPLPAETALPRYDVLFSTGVALALARP